MPAKSSNRIPPVAQDKLAFLLALVPFLIERPRISVVEVADHFDVSPDEVRKAVRLIAVSGIPGETSQYQPGDLFDIAWDDFEENDHIVLTNLVAIDDSPRFSAREAAALIAGLQYLSSLPENRDNDRIGALMRTLSRGASATPSAVAIASNADADENLAVLRQAIAASRRVEFDYRNSRGESERRPVDPLLVESVDADWYLRGWCHLRHGVRTFRLDRMTFVAATDVPVAHTRADVPLSDRLFESTSDDPTVVLEIERAALPLVADYLADAEMSEVDGSPRGAVRAVVRVAHHHGLTRLVAANAGLITVVEPADARAAVAAWTQAALDRYAGGTDR